MQERWKAISEQMNMLISDKPVIFSNKKFEDSRGYFLELYRKEKLNVDFVQDNFSYSKKNVFRGMHLQINNPQGKFISCLCGKIFDIVLDCNPKSINFGKLYKYILTPEVQLYVPPMYAHGFYCVSDEAFISYKCTEYYDKYSEISFDIKQFKNEITEFDMSNIIISDKDNNGLNFKEYFYDKK